MVHVIYPVLCLTVLVLFRKRRPYLAPAEVAAVFLFSMILYIMMVAAISFAVYVPDLLKSSDEWERLPYVILNRTLLYPAMVTLFVNQAMGARTWPGRLVLFVVWGAVLFGVEWINDRLQVVIQVQWEMWYSLLLWGAMLLVPLGFLKWFQAAGRKDRVEA